MSVAYSKPCKEAIVAKLKGTKGNVGDEVGGENEIWQEFQLKMSNCTEMWTFYNNKKGKSYSQLKKVKVQELERLENEQILEDRG